MLTSPQRCPCSRTKPYPNVYLAIAHDKQSDEDVTQPLKIQVYRFLSSEPDPQPAIACQRQLDESLKREFTVLRCFPASQAAVRAIARLGGKGATY